MGTDPRPASRRPQDDVMVAMQCTLTLKVLVKRQDGENGKDALG
jgi:hypothetical protein